MVENKRKMEETFMRNFFIYTLLMLNVAVKWLVLQTQIQEVFGSNLGIRYCDFFVVFLSHSNNMLI
jgi:hypothetical protein